MESFTQYINELWLQTQTLVTQQSTYVQIAIIFVSYAAAYWLYSKTVKKSLSHEATKVSSDHPVKLIFSRVSNIVYPLVAIVLLRVSVAVGGAAEYPVWLINIAFVIAVLLFFYSIITEFVSSPFMATLFKLVGLPILFLHLIDLLPALINALEEISISVGNIQVSLYGLTRVLFFGALLFWLGRASSNVGKVIIRNQSKLDISQH